MSGRQQIRQAIEGHGPMKPAQIAEHVEITAQYVRDLASTMWKEGELGKHEDGRYDLPENAPTGIDEHDVGGKPAPDNLHLIPEVEVDAGPGREPQLEEINGGFYVPEDYIRRVYGVRPGKLCVMRVIGDSMKDTLQPGQRVIAARWEGERPRDGAIYGLHGPTGFMVKRLRFDRKDGKDVIWIWSDNDERGRWWVTMDEFEDEYTPLAWALEVGKKL